MTDASSPLWMAVREPAVEQLVGYLTRSLRALREEQGVPEPLVFSRTALNDARVAFADAIRVGEARLHRLCTLLNLALFEGEWDTQAVVIGQAPTSGRRFTFMRPVSDEELYHHTDLALGRRVLAEVRIEDDGQWRSPDLVANFVDYQPHKINSWGVQKAISRIKAEEEIWNKVVDELFHLDELVARDKELRQLSYYVKDIFGLKLVVAPMPALAELQGHLETVRFNDALLAEAGVSPGPDTERLQFLEVKNYLGGKESGWEALKSVVSWWGHTFEIQIQPLGNYHRERDFLSRESHTAFKGRREAIRDRVAARDPHFRFTRDLLRWLFGGAEGDAPSAEGVAIRLEE